jgi:hypothetical protein
MRTKQLLRFSLASLTVIATCSGAFLIACGDDDSSGTPGKDAGNNETSTPGQDAAAGDSGKDSGKDAGPPPAKLQLVNAATDLGPADTSGALRVCYGLADTLENAGKVEKIAQLPPLPDVAADPAVRPAALPNGTGGPVATTGASFQTVAIVPYVMNAAALAARGHAGRKAGQPVGTSCADLFAAVDAGGAGGALKPGVDYWKLEGIAPGTLKDGKSYILVLTGCASNAAVGAAKCGPGFTGSEDPGNGNLKVSVFEVDNSTTVEATKIGAQFIHASPAGASFLQQTGGVPVRPGFTTKADGGTGTFKSITNNADVALLAPTASLSQVEGITVASDFFIANPLVDRTAIPLTTIQFISFGGAAPPAGKEYGNGKAFTFIAVGDPEQDPGTPGAPNLKTFHYLGFPNDPIIPQFQ